MRSALALLALGVGACTTPHGSSESPSPHSLDAASRRIAIHAMDAVSARIRVHVNNLANASTPAFKRWRVDVAEAPYHTVHVAEATRDNAGVELPIDLYIGGGSRLVATTRVHEPGTLAATGRLLDLAIDGPGFFRVLVHGESCFTRNGALAINADGKLVTGAGHVLRPEITLTQDVIRLDIDPEGRATVCTQGNATVQQIGQVQLARFLNPGGLRSLGDGLFGETAASGHSIFGSPNGHGLGNVRQGFLELSNVNADAEVLMLEDARREYDLLRRHLLDER